MKFLWDDAKCIRVSPMTCVHRQYDNPYKSQQHVLCQVQIAAVAAKSTGWNYLAPIVQKADLETGSFQHFNTEHFWCSIDKVSGLYLDTTRNEATGIALLLSSQTVHCRRKLSSVYKSFLTSMEAPRVGCSSHPKLPVSLLHRPSLGHTVVDCWEKQVEKARNQHSIWNRL